MRLPIWTVNQNVIEEDQEELPCYVLEDMIHEALKGTRSIGEAERHYQVLVVTRVRFESGFIYVGWSHSELVKSSAEVQFREVHRAS